MSEPHRPTVRDPATLPEVIERIRRHYGEGCFACGRDNPIGLHLDGFTLDGSEVTARFLPRPEYRGVPAVLHGGVAATALDEVMVWAGALIEDVMTVTGNMQLRFRRPVPTDRELRVRGRVVQRSGRRLRLAGELFVDGRVAVEASGLYLVSVTVEELLRHGT